LLGQALFSLLAEKYSGEPYKVGGRSYVCAGASGPDDEGRVVVSELAVIVCGMEANVVLEGDMVLGLVVLRQCETLDEVHIDVTTEPKPMIGYVCGRDKVNVRLDVVSVVEVGRNVGKDFRSVRVVGSLVNPVLVLRIDVKSKLAFVDAIGVLMGILLEMVPVEWDIKSAKLI
jgi:hypothetical protein